MSTCRSGRTIRRSREGFCTGSVQKLSFGLISWLHSTVVLIIIFLCKTFSCIQGLRIMDLLTLTSQMRPLRGSYIQEKQKSFGSLSPLFHFQWMCKEKQQGFSHNCIFGTGDWVLLIWLWYISDSHAWIFISKCSLLTFFILFICMRTCLYMCAILTWGYSLTTVLVSTAMFFITAGLTCTHFPPRIKSRLVLCVLYIELNPLISLLNNRVCHVRFRFFKGLLVATVFLSVWGDVVVSKSWDIAIFLNMASKMCLLVWQLV